MTQQDRTVVQYHKMTETPIPRLILSLAAPTILSMLITSIYNLADTFFVGRISTSASGAVGVVSSLMAIIQALGFMLGHGSGTIISRRLGSQDTHAATRFASTSFFTALAFGVMLAKLGNRASVVSNFISQFNDVMMEMTMTVMKVAPVGVFCLIARTFATVGFSAFAPMLKYMGNVTLALALQCFVIYQVLLFVFTRLNPIKFVKKFLPVMGFAFSTATSNATIPMSIDTLNKKMGVSKQISSFTIPLGATINMDGTSIMQGVAVIFIAEAYGIHLTPANLATVVVTATLASIGTAGIPSVGLVTLAMVLNSVGLPTEGIALIMGIDRILDMARTAVNITGDAVCTTIVAHQDGALNKSVFNKN